MCNRYRPPQAEILESQWQLKPGRLWTRGDVFPRGQGPFLRAARDSTECQREIAVGQWALIPWFAKTPKLTYSTNNARSEELEAKAAYKYPWQRGQRCIIPADIFWEPNWESGKNQWWQFRRADGEAWGLAGLWNIWTDKATGEVFESYTMLTLNADKHPLMNRMHKPDPALGPDQQDKRSVIPIAMVDVDTWLAGTIEEAKRLLRLAPVEAFEAGPAPA